MDFGQKLIRFQSCHQFVNSRAAAISASAEDPEERSSYRKWVSEISLRKTLLKTRKAGCVYLFIIFFIASCVRFCLKLSTDFIIIEEIYLIFYGLRKLFYFLTTSILTILPCR